MKEIKIKETVFKPGRPKVAVPITGCLPEDIISECEAAADMPCDVIEWRADYYLAALENLDEALCSKETYVDLVKILDDINYIAGPKPVIFTVRSVEQGGQVKLTDAQNDSICSLIAQSQLADFIDVELLDEKGAVNELRLRDQINQIHQFGGNVILSFHEFDRMLKPDEVVQLAKMMTTFEPDMSKIAVMAGSEEDTKMLLKTTAYLTQKGIGPMITIAMGEEGKASRVVAGKYGSYLTFAAGISETAPGQADVNTMKEWLDRYYGA